MRFICAKDEKEKNNSVLHRGNGRFNDDTLLCIVVFVFVSLLFKAKRKCALGRAQRWSGNRSVTSPPPKKRRNRSLFSKLVSWSAINPNPLTKTIFVLESWYGSGVFNPDLV